MSNDAHRPKCQCDPRCQRVPLEKEPYCQYHKTHGCGIKSPTTGVEPTRAILDEYNTNPAKRRSHNCYSFAKLANHLKKISDCKEKNKCNFDVPGETAGHPGFRGIMGKRCSDIVARTLADIPEAVLTTFEGKCAIGYSKIAVVVDKNNDFHYYIQLADGSWAHKPGGRKATLLDSNGSQIMRPDLAGRYYPAEYDGDSELDYSSFCNYICLPRTHPIVSGGGWRRVRGLKTRRRLRIKQTCKQTAVKSKKRRSARSRRQT